LPSDGPTSFVVPLAISDDATLDAIDVLQLVESVPSLEPGQSVQLPVQIPGNPSTLRKYLNACIDAARASKRGFVEKKNEQNNFVVGRIQ